MNRPSSSDSIHADSNPPDAIPAEANPADAIRLDANYRAAIYLVEPDGTAIETRIGQSNTALAELMQRHGSASAALITACNPAGETLSETSNRQRQAEFEQQLRAAGQAFVPALGGSPDRRWQEPSVLLGIDQAAADIWARHWGQLAYVLYDARGEARLRWLDRGAA